jgi:hypothetical protein
MPETDLAFSFLISHLNPLTILEIYCPQLKNEKIEAWKNPAKLMPKAGILASSLKARLQNVPWLKNFLCIV